MARALQAHHLQPWHSTTSFFALSPNSNPIRPYLSLDFDPFYPNEAKPPCSTTESSQCQHKPPHTISIVNLQGYFEGFSVVCCWVLGLFLVVCTEEVLGLIFWVLEAIFLCFFFLDCIFWVFLVRFWVFFYANFLVFWLGFYVIALGFFLGLKYDLQRAIWWCLWGFCRRVFG